MWLTIISTICTAISIVFAIISICQAKKARKYKEEVINFKDALEIKAISETYKEARLKFLQETRADDWYKGKDVNLILSPMESVLAKIDSVYPLMTDSRTLKEKVNMVTSEIRQFDKCSMSSKRKTYDTLIEIGQILQDVLHSQMEKAVIDKPMNKIW